MATVTNDPFRRLVAACFSAFLLLGAAAFVSRAEWQDDPAAAKKPQEPEQKEETKRKPGGLRVPVGRVPKSRRDIAKDPLKQAEAPAVAPNPNANPAPEKAKDKGAAEKAKQKANANPAIPQLPLWPFHYTLKLAGADGAPLSASYYPARESFQAPVLLLLHELGAGRGGKDFEQPIEELKGNSFARHMQKAGFAVLVLNPRGSAAAGERDGQANARNSSLMVADLQSAYRFLIDRHNRGEVNLAKFGVVALGDASNLAAAWAGSPGGGVSNEGRLSDIGAIVMISPVAEIPGIPLARVLPTIATRFPLLAMAGDRDAASIQTVRDNQRIIERHRLSRAAFYDTTLHSGKMLTFFPKLTTIIERFLDDPVKNRKVEWEPRFLFDPVLYDEIQLVPDGGFAPLAGAQNAAQPRNEPRKAPAAKDAVKKN